MGEGAYRRRNTICINFCLISMKDCITALSSLYSKVTSIRIRNIVKIRPEFVC